jgi:hypothetical protein
VYVVFGYVHSRTINEAGDAGVCDLTVISPRGAAGDGLVGGNRVVGVVGVGDTFPPPPV